MKPIEKLLASKTDPTWSEPCTDALNKIVSLVFKRLKLAIFQPDQPLRLYVGSQGDVASIAFTQKRAGVEVPVIFSGKRLLIGEQKCTETELLVRIAVWAATKFRSYAYNASEL